MVPTEQLHTLAVEMIAAAQRVVGVAGPMNIELVMVGYSAAAGVAGEAVLDYSAVRAGAYMDKLTHPVRSQNIVDYSNLRHKDIHSDH